VIAERLRARVGRLSTSVKMLVILTVALLPLGTVALLASIQANHDASVQRDADLRIAASERARRIGDALADDIAAMRVATNALAFGGTPDESCARMAALADPGESGARRFALFGVERAALCNTAGFAAERPSTVALELGPRTVIRAGGIDVIVPATNGSAVALAHYPASRLATMTGPAHATDDVALRLDGETDSLELLTPRFAAGPDISTERAPVGQLGLTLAVSTRAMPLDTRRALLAFLPLLMWASAAVVTFLLVERLLIRPLRMLRNDVAQAEGAPSFATARTPAREIRDLAETFVRTQQAIAAQQAGLSAALADQMRATREVHHRVKNNLQIIASLINLHARAATGSEAASAYAAIQRRVDALAIVHRNHYAELDAEGGIDLRRLLGEIAANLRASLGQDGVAAPPITLAAGSVTVSQDVAIALGFLLTELVELSSTIGPAEIAVSIAASAEGPATIAVRSAALQATAQLEDRLAARYARVLEGLARQLRAPLRRDKRRGRFSIAFKTVPSRD